MGQKQRLTPARALITGAGSGLGFALARRLVARRGSNPLSLVLADIDLGRAETSAAALRAPGVDCQALPVDVADEASWQALAVAVANSGTPIDLLINNAGVASAGSAFTTSNADFRWTLDIDLMGVVHGCRQFGPGLVAQGHGAILNVASFAGLAMAPGLAAYTTAKAAVVAYTEALHQELRGSGVRVSVACPAFFQTRLMDSFRGPAGGRAFAERAMRKSKVDAETVAERLLDGLYRGEVVIVPTTGAHRMWRLRRIAPSLYRLLLDRAMRRTSRRD